MEKYMLIFKGGDAEAAKLSPDEMQQHMQKWYKWVQDLTEQEIYLGGENLTNYSQPNPIVSAEDPYGSNFDASLIWAPIFGTMYYAGLRFRIK